MCSLFTTLSFSLANLLRPWKENGQNSWHQAFVSFIALFFFNLSGACGVKIKAGTVLNVRILHEQLPCDLCWQSIWVQWHCQAFLFVLDTSSVCSLKKSKISWNPWKNESDQKIFSIQCQWCICFLMTIAMSLLNSKFWLAPQKLALDPRCKGMPLSSFLLKPMQRITRYPLLIKSVSTPSEVL